MKTYGVQTYNIGKQQHDNFLMRVFLSKSKKWFRNWSHSKVGNWETRKVTSARSFSDTLQTPQARTFCEIVRKYVKLNFRK